MFFDQRLPALKFMDQHSRYIRLWRSAWMWCFLAAVISAAPSYGQLAQDMEGSVVADAGDYNYNGQQYDDVNVADVVLEGTVGTINDAGNTLGQAASFIDRASSFGGWLGFNEGNGFLGIRAGAGFRAPSVFLRTDQLRRRNLRGVRFGPFFINDPTMGAGLLYSDYQGTRVGGGGRGRGGDDNWASVVWGSVNVSAYVSNSFALSIRPFVFWLPMEGKLGWSAGSAMFGFGSQSQMAPNSMLDFAYATKVGNWDLSVYDRFSAMMLRSSFLDGGLFYQAIAQDLTPIDTAGRYALGGYGSTITDTRNNSNISVNDRFLDNDSMQLRNMAGVMLNGLLAETIRSSFFYQRYDSWDDSFNHNGSWNTLGAFFMQPLPRITKYAGYTATFQDQGDSLIQWAFAGFNAGLSPTLSIDARVGYVWADTGRQGRESAMGQVSLQHQLGERTFHGITAGRMVTDPEFNSRYLADFVRYYLVHQMSMNAELRLFAQASRFERLNGSSYERSSFAAGALFTWRISPYSRVTILNSYETADFAITGRQWEMWTHRIGYSHQLSETLSAQAFYQYQHSDSDGSVGDAFSEHLFYMGVVKQF